MADDEITVVLPPLEHAIATMRRLRRELRDTERVIGAAVGMVESDPDGADAVGLWDELIPAFFALEQIAHGTAAALGRLRDQYQRERGARGGADPQ